MYIIELFKCNGWINSIEQQCRWNTNRTHVVMKRIGMELL